MLIALVGAPDLTGEARADADPAIGHHATASPRREAIRLAVRATWRRLAGRSSQVSAWGVLLSLTFTPEVWRPDSAVGLPPAEVVRQRRCEALLAAPSDSRARATRERWRALGCGGAL